MFFFLVEEHVFVNNIIFFLRGRGKILFIIIIFEMMAWF